MVMFVVVLVKAIYMFIYVCKYTCTNISYVYKYMYYIHVYIYTDINNTCFSVNKPDFCLRSRAPFVETAPGFRARRRRRDVSIDSEGHLKDAQPVV